MMRLLAFFVFALWGAMAVAETDINTVLNFSKVKSNEGEFLPPDEAFKLQAAPAGPDRVQLQWQVTEGYYLYKSRMKAVTTSDQAQLGPLSLPQGEEKEDEYFGKQEVYHHDVEATLPVSRGAAGQTVKLPLKVTYQGCADKGLCYPPITKTIDVSLPPGSSGSSTSFVSEQDRLATLIRSGNIFLVLGTFFGFGLLLAFTPCVLPMVPILSGIIAGHGDKVTTGRAFALSLTYVLGMAMTYTAAGAMFAAAGQQVQAVFQQAWIVILFAGLFIVLALSMFGLFTIQMPSFVQTRLSEMSNRQAAGTFGGVAVMGALSALIVTTCVAPPLVATLAVIGQSGDMVRGAAALFSMSLGMGAPLLVVGASAGKLLPKAGPWMETVKALFGVMMLLVAAWMLSRIVPERAALVLWAIPAFIAAVLFWRMTARESSTVVVTRLASVAAGVYGVLLVTGAALGGTDPLAPVAHLSKGRQHSDLPFQTIKSVADLQREVTAAKSKAQPVLLDFYADWCVSCKEMEKYTFTDAAVQESLKHARLLRADVTANDAEDQALLKHFGIFGPPTIAFYGPNGEERSNYRVVGYMKAPEFASLSRQAMN
jgi:thioredoxin:protein disulfide reductase